MPEIDTSLESAIASVGAGRIYAHVRAAGWTDMKHDPPPKWVWWMAVAELMKADESAKASS